MSSLVQTVAVVHPIVGLSESEEKTYAGIHMEQEEESQEVTQRTHSTALLTSKHRWNGLTWGGLCRPLLPCVRSRLH